MPYQTVHILIFIVIITRVVGAIGLIIVGCSNIKKNGISRNSIVFLIIGFMIAIYFVINERILNLITAFGGPSFYEDLWPIFYQLLYEIIPNLILISTFGGLFLFLGIKNKQNYGKFLIFSSISWIIFGVISLWDNILILLNSSHIFVIYFHITISINPIIRESVLIINSNFMVISMVFLLIYAVKMKERILMYSSIVFLVAARLYTLSLIFAIFRL